MGQRALTLSLMLQVLYTMTSASFTSSAQAYPALSSVPAIRSESAKFIYTVQGGYAGPCRRLPDTCLLRPMTLSYELPPLR